MTLRPEVSHSSPAKFEPMPLPALASQPLVSVLLANYNYANYLDESIRSVLGQSYANWELIICDDGSTDNSVEVIRKYVDADKRITLITKENGGHASALNGAFETCRGDVICLLDSDDLFLPDKFASVIQSFRQRPDCGLVIHRILRVDQNRTHEGVYPLRDVADGWLGPELLATGGIFSWAPPTCGISFRRDVARALFPLSIAAPLHMCPDQVIMRLAPLFTAVARIPGTLSEYRVHGGNTYSLRTVSAASITQQLDISRALWNEQHRFLAGGDQNLATRLLSVEESALTAKLELMRAKLENSPAVHECLRKYLAVGKGELDSKWIAFWKAAIYLPNFLFQPMVNLLFGQGPLKQLVARIRRLV